MLIIFELSLLLFIIFMDPYMTHNYELIHKDINYYRIYLCETGIYAHIFVYDMINQLYNISKSNI